MKHLDLYSHRGQEIMLLIAALHLLQKARPKNDVIDFIQREKWIDLQAIDKKPYTQSLTDEPRWRNSIAHARRDCVDFELMESDNDYWLVTKSGLNLVPTLREQFKAGELDIRKLWYLSEHGKRIYCPHYEWAEQDSKRPVEFYKDERPTTHDLLMRYNNRRNKI